MKKPRVEDFVTSGSMINPYGNYDYEKYSEQLEKYIEFLNKENNIFLINLENEIINCNKKITLYQNNDNMEVADVFTERKKGLDKAKKLYNENK